MCRGFLFQASWLPSVAAMFSRRMLLASGCCAICAPCILQRSRARARRGQVPYPAVRATRGYKRELRAAVAPWGRGGAGGVAPPVLSYPGARDLKRLETVPAGRRARNRCQCRVVAEVAWGCPQDFGRTQLPDTERPSAKSETAIGAGQPSSTGLSRDSSRVGSSMLNKTASWADH